LAGALPQTSGRGAYSFLPDLLAGFKGRRRKGEGSIKGEVGPPTFQTKVTLG